VTEEEWQWLGNGIYVFIFFSSWVFLPQTDVFRILHFFFFLKMFFLQGLLFIFLTKEDKSETNP